MVYLFRILSDFFQIFFIYINLNILIIIIDKNINFGLIFNICINYSIADKINTFHFLLTIV